jgi:hypothetical protein
MPKKFTLCFVIAAAILTLGVASNVSAQHRDYMTDEEIELVRDNQDIDKRIEVLTKMVDRRFTALGLDVGGWKQSKKDDEKWGAIRTGTRSELFYDIRQILQKAIDDIDDVALHNENTLTQNKTEGELFPKAVRDLAAAANRYIPVLKTAVDKTTDEREKGVILSSIENCEAILDSVKQLPPETKKKKTDR